MMRRLIYHLVASGDRSWRDFTALAYHFWTQPLPNRLSYYVHRLPMVCLKVSISYILTSRGHKSNDLLLDSLQFSTAASLFIEIVTPIFMFGSFMFRAVGKFI